MTGDLTAIDAIDAKRQVLYEGMDYRNQDRVRKNLVLMKTALDPLGKAAGKDSEAFKALQYANSKADLRPFACDAFGLAAANGNEKALDALISYKENGWLLSSVTFSLGYAAGQNQPKAVDFLIAVLKDPSAKALHQEASQGLVGASYKGNHDAKAALAEYAHE
jgi:hypothetical protein